MFDKRLLVVDDNELDLEIISMVCKGIKCEVDIAQNGENALALAKENHYDAVLSDYQMEPINGIELVSTLKAILSDAAYLIITGYPDVRVREFTRDADYCDLVVKPIQVKTLMEALRIALGRTRGATLEMDQIAFSNRMDACLALVGESEKIGDVRQQLRKALLGRTSLLLEGPVGIGKAEIARLVRDYGPYGNSHFVECHCDELSEEELSEQLIDEAGKWGTLLEEAREGTLALYNVEKIPLQLQIALGKAFSVITDELYLIAQAHCSLEDAMGEGDFDIKLYFELSRYVVRLSPLRERMEDVEPIVRYVATSPSRFGLPRRLSDEEIKTLAHTIELKELTRNIDELVLSVRRFASI